MDRKQLLADVAGHYQLPEGANAGERYFNGRTYHLDRITLEDAKYLAEHSPDTLIKKSAVAKPEKPEAKAEKENK